MKASNMLAATTPLLIAVLAFGSPHTVLARDVTDPYESYRSDSDGSKDFDFDDSHIVPWKELEADIPVLSEEGLEEFEIDHGPPGLAYQVDMETLSVGDDNVVRYWLVTTSGGRRTNVLFEGIHCAEAMYKTYAYASPRRTSLIKPVQNPRWSQIGSTANRDYHNELMNSYFCWKGSPRSRNGMFNATRGSIDLNSPAAEDADFIKP